MGNKTRTATNSIRVEKEFDIWMEGYAVNEDHGIARRIGRGFGNTFDEAIKDYISKNPNHGIKENKRNRYISSKCYQNRRSNWNIWACNLFDNETDARKLCG